MSFWQSIGSYSRTRGVRGRVHRGKGDYSIKVWKGTPTIESVMEELEKTQPLRNNDVASFDRFTDLELQWQN